MSYFGGKSKSIDFIETTIDKFIGSDKLETFGDLFAGLGTVGIRFKEKGYKVISNDIQYYAYVYNKHFIENNLEVTLLLDLLKDIDSKKFPSEKLFCSNHYTNDTKYFTPNNALAIDIARNFLEEKKQKNQISENQYFYNLVCLMEAVNKISNAASMYTSFLKYYQKRACNVLNIKPLPIIKSDKIHKVYNTDALEVAMNNVFDIVYLDPPFNRRQYGSNYHVLETIALWDFPEVEGITNLRKNCYSSPWCSSVYVNQVFEELIKKIDSKYIFFSYRSDGLLNIDYMKSIFSKKGTLQIEKKPLRKQIFKEGKLVSKRDDTIEYLFCIKVK